MNRLMHAGVLLAVIVATAGCASTEYKVARASTADGSILNALNLNAPDVKYQAPCIVAVRHEPPARALSCIYVQTANELYFLRFNDTRSQYEPAARVRV